MNEKEVQEFLEQKVKLMKEEDSRFKGITIPKMTFTWNQIKELSDRYFIDDNPRGLNRNVNYDRFSKDHIFETKSIMLHDFGMLKPRPTHMRVFMGSSTQDMYIEDYFKGTWNGSSSVGMLPNEFNTIPYSIEEWKMNLDSNGFKFMTRDEVKFQLQLFSSSVINTN